VDFLECIFIPETSSGQKHRILIVDGHDSHETGKFQYLCYQNNKHPLFLLVHSSYKLQPLDMGPFSPLLNAYSKALQKFTPIGVATLNRRIFIKIYAEIRPKSLSERVIWAGWKRMGLYPLNKQGILDDEEVKNFGRTTPDYQPPPVPEGPNGVFTTPKKFEDIQALKSQLELQSTPITRRKIEKLGNAAVQGHTSTQLAGGQLKQLRDEAVHVERNKRSKWIEKQENQRS
jgi:DDE superfamily endonuclease